jgi:hypothetical protein
MHKCKSIDTHSICTLDGVYHGSRLGINGVNTLLLSPCEDEGAVFTIAEASDGVSAGLQIHYRRFHHQQLSLLGRCRRRRFLLILCIYIYSIRRQCVQ